MRCPRCHAENSDTQRFCGECGSSLRGHITEAPDGAQQQAHRPGSSGSGPRSPEAMPTRTMSMPASPFRSGELLAGKYRVVDELGRGGMGVVVRAEDTRLERTVVLKFLSQELTGDPEARERFVQEARAASAIIVIIVFIPSAQADVLDSIAILPLVNDSGDPSQDYFSDSLTDMLISELYKVSELRVSPRQSVMAFKKTTKPVKKIAAELSVKAVFEGSVLKSGNRIRLIGRLVDPFANRQIWGETLERDYEEILYLQSELCQAIVGGIRVALNPEERKRLAAAGKVNPEAYDLVMKGTATFWDFSGSMSFLDQMHKALDYVNQAISIDPAFALAHHWVAFIYWSCGHQGIMDQKEAYLKAKEAALKALELDSDLAHARCVLGCIKFEMDWDFVGAEREWRRAAELAPGDWWVMNTVEQYLIRSGKPDEGIALFKRRVEEKEKSQSKKIYRVQGTILYLFAGRNKEALENQREVLGSISDPNSQHIFWLAVSYAVNGMYSEAIAEMDKIKDLPAVLDNPEVRSDFAWIWAVSGYREEALKELDKIRSLMAQWNKNSSFYAARVYAGLGENDRSFECLYQAYECHSSLMVHLISDFGLRSLRGDPRFEELVRKIGFPVIPDIEF